jgi:hypothetical protein
MFPGHAAAYVSVLLELADLGDVRLQGAASVALQCLIGERGKLRPCCHFAGAVALAGGSWRRSLVSQTTDDRSNRDSDNHPLLGKVEGK